VKESILSILPIVDEYIILLGESDQDDQTRQEIESINSPKIKIIDSVWEKEKYPHNTVYARETDKAMEHCSGDWLFYLQSDEVVHEKFHDRIIKACSYYQDDSDVEGLLFEYKHFWGDFNHYFNAHNWYPREIRIIRNRPEIHSWRDAQSFRVFGNFNYTWQEYLSKKNTRKLKVARIFAEIYHYGWVRPPKIMTAKTKATDPAFSKKLETDGFDYGPLNKLQPFKDSHPEVMMSWISKIFDWKDNLQYQGNRDKSRQPYKHEKLKYRILSYLEYTFLGGKQIGGFRNYRIIRNFFGD